MKVVPRQGIIIELEQEEIIDMWNIIMFALDLHTEKVKKGEPCMTMDELKLANNLIDTLDKIKD